MPKFKHANPYPVPRDLPEDDVALAVLALRRMAVDKQNKVTVWNSAEEDSESTEDTFVASAQSPAQQTLITKHNPDVPLFVEGGYTCWLRHKMVTYFILRADPDLEFLEKLQKAQKRVERDENLFDWVNFWEDEEGGQLVPARSLHEQDDGTVLAMAVTGARTKDSLVTWVRCLQRANPSLHHVPIVFRIRTPHSELQVIGSKTPNDGLQVLQL